MTKADIITKILQAINHDSYVRVYFRDIARGPAYGKFIDLEDAQDMWKKGFVRFIYSSNIDDFNNLPDSILKYAWTKLFSITSIEDITIY